jgi:TetR/AcrR family acrAB operon transcriptional repressor
VARRSKEDAAQTRNAILDAASICFNHKGVSRTSLEEIAAFAGMTRGAVYWHFDDKDALFNALMLEHLIWPIDALFQHSSQAQSMDPLCDLQADIVAVLSLLTGSPRMCMAFEIAMWKVEFLPDKLELSMWRKLSLDAWAARAEQHLIGAQALGLIGAGIQTAPTALAIWFFVSGLIRTWVLDIRAFDLVEQGRSILGVYVAGLICRQVGSASCGSLVFPES